MNTDLRPASPTQQSYRVWTASISKRGTVSQCSGVARHLDEQASYLCTDRRSFFERLLSPKPWRHLGGTPDVVISCGWRAEKMVGQMEGRLLPRPTYVHLQIPNVVRFDMAFVPSHLWMEAFDERPGFHKTIGVATNISPSHLQSLRAKAREMLGLRDRKVLVFLIGGKSDAFSFPEANVAEIRQSALKLAEAGWFVVIATSPRTESFISRSLSGLDQKNIRLWDRNDGTTYPELLSSADAYLITSDSITMPCEALASGRPVYTFDLEPIKGRAHDKMLKFHDEFRHELGLTRLFKGTIDSYNYRPLNEAEKVADEIRSFIASGGRP